MPCQASAVPCERVFSSSKETDSLRRNKLAPKTMEMLQILKYRFRQDRERRFMEDLLDTEDMVEMAGLSEGEAEAMIKDGSLDDLRESMRTLNDL
ncbi:hypothetical protein C8F01DRAFT_1067568 [Mycena amicta]|nr:hypothetical protein C8F01DRAFT_1067568 [Mycena amicta]